MIDPAKTYRTRDGREVRIYAVDGPKGSPTQVHGAVKEDAEWRLIAWFNDGAYSVSENPNDLIEVRPKQVRWVNIYPDGWLSESYDSQEKARRHSSLSRVACIRVEFEEGEGL